MQSADKSGIKSLIYQLQLDIYPTEPYLDNLNSTCTDLIYNYLDNEPEGEYYLGFSKCFMPSNYNFIYAISYSEGGMIDSEIIQANATTGELRIKAYMNNYGRYRVRLTGTSVCSRAISIDLLITINTSPKAKSS